MYDNYRVIVCTPAGRKEYLSILLRYILANLWIVDEWHLWFNTTKTSDVEYINELEQKYPFVSIIRCCNPAIDPQGREVIESWATEHQTKFYLLPNDSDTIYIKMDDDIVFVASDCIKNLVDCKIRTPQKYVVSANVINNAICTYILQSMAKVLPTNFGKVDFGVGDPIGWEDPIFAEDLHDYFLNHIDDLEQFKTIDFDLFNFAQISINCICWMGKDHDKFFEPLVETYPSHEQFITTERASQLGQGTLVCGTAIVSHFAFWPQRPYLLTTNILDRYVSLADKVLGKEEK